MSTDHPRATATPNRTRICGVIGCRSTATCRITHPNGIRTVCDPHAGGHPVIEVFER